MHIFKFECRICHKPGEVHVEDTLIKDDEDIKFFEMIIDNHCGECCKEKCLELLNNHRR